MTDHDENDLSTGLKLGWWLLRIVLVGLALWLGWLAWRYDWGM